MPTGTSPVLRLSFALVLIGVATVFYLDTRDLQGGVYEPLGPGAFPRLLSLSIIALAAVMLVQSFVTLWRGAVAAKAAGYRPRADLAAATCLLSVVYVAAMDTGLAGFRLATFVFVLVLALLLMRFAWRRLPAVLAVALLMSLGLHYLFTEVFVVDLP